MYCTYMHCTSIETGSKLPEINDCRRDIRVAHSLSIHEVNTGEDNSLFHEIVQIGYHLQNFCRLESRQFYTICTIKVLWVGNMKQMPTISDRIEKLIIVYCYTNKMSCLLEFLYNSKAHVTFPFELIYWWYLASFNLCKWLQLLELVKMLYLLCIR